MSAPVPAVRAIDPLEELDGRLNVSPNAALERIWHLFISMRFGLVLMLILAVLTLVGTLLVQAPAGMRADPQAYAAWLGSVRPRYGGWTNVFEALGFFSIFDSWLFRGVTVLLVTSTVACSVNRTPLLWKQTTKPRMNVSDAFFSHASHRAEFVADAGPEEAAGRLAAAFRAQGYRTLTQAENDGATVHLYADRFRWAPFGTVVAHMSLPVILIGTMIGATLGFKEADFIVPVGSTVEVGHDTGLAVLATSFVDRYYPDTGQPADYASDLVLYENGAQVATQTVRVNEPLRYGDVTFYQSFFGPAMEVSVADASATLHTGGVPLRFGTNDGLERAGFFTLPERDLTVYVYGAQSGETRSEIKAGQARIELYKGDGNTFLDGAIVDQGKPVTIGGLTFTFVREQQFTGLIAARDPGVPFVWGGAILLLLGVAVVFYFHNRRIWAIVHRAPGGSTVSVAAVVRHDVTYRQEFGQLIDGIQRTLATATR